MYYPAERQCEAYEALAGLSCFQTVWYPLPLNMTASGTDEPPAPIMTLTVVFLHHSPHC